MGVHDNHRARLKQQYLEGGADCLTDARLLELYLFYAIPRKDVNPLANLLLERFGTLDGVFRASVKELEQVPGMGTQAACCIHLLRDLAQRCQQSRVADGDARITHWREAGDYLLPFFYGAISEQVYLLCLDLSGRVLRCQCLSRGEADFATLEVEKLVDFALGQQAAAVILAHNHPGGSLEPSPADIHATQVLAQALAVAGIRLVDHLIVADGQYASMTVKGASTN